MQKQKQTKKHNKKKQKTKQQQQQINKGKRYLNRAFLIKLENKEKTRKNFKCCLTFFQVLFEKFV